MQKKQQFSLLTQVVFASFWGEKYTLKLCPVFKDIYQYLTSEIVHSKPISWMLEEKNDHFNVVEEKVIENISVYRELCISSWATQLFTKFNFIYEIVHVRRCTI